MRLLKVCVAIVLCVSLAGCITVDQKIDPKLGIKITSIGVTGCGDPSHRITYIDRPGHKEDSFASSGPDLCNTATAGAFGVAANAVLPRGQGINNTVYSQSSSLAHSQQSSSIH